VDVTILKKIQMANMLDE